MHEPLDSNAPRDPRPAVGSLTTGDAARHLSVSPNTIKRWIAAGALRAYTTPGGHWRIPLESFARFLTERGLPPIELLEPAGSRER
ncbi:MAG TPA: helix-turn-helix domain-containing protein [Candidatus Eisenbacteria bacterium]|nr:helix-turn-helix domain-containing protein [Candidatus Eisenbacteria bacterium]